MTAEELNALSDVVERETGEYLRRQSIAFLECAVNLCATSMPLDTVADLLEAQAEMLREHG
ncbi:hypothetical protein GOA89_11495 [Sinorhizobium meliloti]|nr:hypothetical protein [Sinorhizobium meliloti]MDW9846926.1 hypothetical protein [Sinorhizobium meliloti]MDX0143730.1 hypothetical protein [Sinorhizobium meliloti]MDX0149755.1 hypothetical protein [Sinorhizobium meliloti]MDX0168970.1 hypothetical protein [Sinorhizobium meliloti]